MARVIESTPEAERKVTTVKSWDGLHTLDYIETPKSHRYELDGKRVKGATTVGEVYPKGEGLIKWMVEQGIQEYMNKTALHKGADVGTVLHNFAECHEKGIAFDFTQVTSSPYEQDIRRVIDRFLKWRTNNKDEVLATETIIASVELQCGGKIDTLRKRAGVGLVLSDYKTSKGIYVTQLLQVIGGYRRMYREWVNLDIPYVEIVTFPKQPDQEMHVLLADNNGWVKDGVRTDIPDLFKKVELQFERNLGTYLFRSEVEDKINPYVRKK